MTPTSEQPEAHPSERPDSAAAQPGWLERLLRPFTDVEPGEAGTALLMFVNLFLLLLGYYVLRTVREPLILASGAEVTSYASAGQALTLMGFVPLYGWFASKVGRGRLILGFILFFIVCLELFSLAGRAGLPYVGIAYYIWVGIFSLATVAQFWSFASDIYRREAGERLFPFIFLGATLGAPVGAWLTGRLFKARVNPYDMMHVTTAILFVHLALYRLIDRRESGRPGQAAAAAPLSAAGGFRLVFATPYLRLLAALIVLLNVVNTTGNYIWNKSLIAAASAAVAGDPSLSKDAFIGELRRGLEPDLHRAGRAAPGLRGLEDRQVPRDARRDPGPAARGARRLRPDRRGRRSRHRQVDQDRRERHRLLGHEHRAAARVAAHEP